MSGRREKFIVACSIIDPACSSVRGLRDVKMTFDFVFRPAEIDQSPPCTTKRR